MRFIPIYWYNFIPCRWNFRYSHWKYVETLIPDIKETIETFSTKKTKSQIPRIIHIVTSFENSLLPWCLCYHPHFQKNLGGQVYQDWFLKWYESLHQTKSKNLNKIWQKMSFKKLITCKFDGLFQLLFISIAFSHPLNLRRNLYSATLLSVVSTVLIGTLMWNCRKSDLERTLDVIKCHPPLCRWGNCDLHDEVACQFQSKGCEQKLDYSLYLEFLILSY